MVPTPGPARPRHRDERGMALVLALMVLLVLTVVGAALMANVTTETKIAGHKVRDTQSLTVAEAGVQEAMLRLRNGDIADDGNPGNVHLIYNAPAGALPASGADTTSLATLQPAGAYLPYSTANKDRMVLSVKYKTRSGVILKYDDTATPKINTITGNPIWQVTSTGRQGSAYRSIYAEVSRSRFNIMVRSAIAANVPIDLSGNIKICGHNHLASTPVNTQPNACNGVAYLAPTAHGSCLPGAWSTNTILQGGSATAIGEPTAKQSFQSGFYAGPWDAMGMLQPEFWPWIGAARAVQPDPPAGIYYLDNDGVKQNQSGDYQFSVGDGEGLLYVDGDVRLNGSFTFKGLIYAEGDVVVNGDVWILGGLVAKGKTGVRITNGSAVILYSSEAIQQNIAKHGGNIRFIAWREY